MEKPGFTASRYIIQTVSHRKVDRVFKVKRKIMSKHGYGRSRKKFVALAPIAELPFPPKDRIRGEGGPVGRALKTGVPSSKGQGLKEV